MGFPVGDTRRSNHSLNELGHLGDGVFDRDRWISAVEVVEVDVINFQLRQRLVEGLVDVFWICSYDPVGVSMGGTELGSEEDFIALSRLLEPT